MWVILNVSIKYASSGIVNVRGRGILLLPRVATAHATVVVSTTAIVTILNAKLSLGHVGLSSHWGRCYILYLFDMSIFNLEVRVRSRRMKSI